MRWHAVRPGRLEDFLYRNRVGGIAFVMLYALGAFFGFALFRELYRESVAGALTRLALLEDSLPLWSILLYAVLPAFLFICCMLYAAYEWRALPLWLCCQLLSGMRCGLCVGLLSVLGSAWAALLNLPLLIGQAALSLLCLEGRRRLPTEGNAYRLVEDFLMPSTAYLIAVSVIHLLFAAILSRPASLTRGGLW